MKLNVTRRDVLRFGAGGVAGVMLTPAPWKALDDLAIWTQNWSWIPQPPKGPSTIRATVCTLCPAGCAASARCIGGLPVSLRAASAATPLCALGLTAHHLPYHPARMSRPARLLRDGVRIRRIPVPADAIVTATARAIADANRSGGTVAVLDTRPGRSVSWAWQRLLGGIAGGVYIPAPGREGANLTTLQHMVEAGESIGLDLDNVKTILSFRAPLAEGWGRPGRIARLLESGTRLIHIDPVRTRTADIANHWLPVKPGSEASLAVAIAHQLNPGVAPLPPAAIEQVTGIPQSEIAGIARELTQNGPSVAIAEEGLGHDAEEAIHALNLALNSSAIIARPEVPPPFDDDVLAPARELDRIADRSIALLLVDASAGEAAFPWPLVQRKLQPKALVVALAPFFGGIVRNAGYVVPTLPPLEALAEVPAASDVAVSQLMMAAPLLPPRKEAFDPAAFVRAIARASQTDLPGDWTKSEELMRGRVAAIYERKEGSVTTIADGSAKAVAEFGSADEMWEAMTAGARWEGERSQCGGAAALSGVAKQRGWRKNAAEAAAPHFPALILVVRTPREATSSAAVSPVMTKLYQESGLRRAPDTAVLNPATARQLGLSASKKARLETSGGTARVTVATDHGVMPGVIEVTAAPDGMALGDLEATTSRTIVDLVAPGPDGSWRSVEARLVAEA